ncbi:MAG: cation:dicarboxylase symporter family transporter [Phycisphaerae bacterium]|nr:dicarboxylate/amino acid:cation symporter [Phycisphaerae bacterium]NIP55137.1 dicarboxylate/amino acid:cation symporter [Phycisphaerae bacterium]NIS53827.1 dicarboxylate/amino acid:cation symporter [Phycisphaerae bacterium]NIU11423.1 dicarboxylate/amino acid:cation symporter [Phycisphaerae bacterium]NIU59665.1 cation:dicarboxylase symporter family transporter [Phycisphaerae bacterium]
MYLKVKIHTQILIAIVLGAMVGLALGEKAEHLKIVGDMFIKLLKMIIIPLILASMVAGIISLGDARRLGRIGLKTFVYYMATTLLAVTVGLLLVNLIKPGVGVDMGAEAAVDMAGRETPSLGSIIKDIIPENPIAAMAENKVLSVIFLSLLLGIAISRIGEKARPLMALFESFNAVMMKITDWIMLLAPVGVFALIAYTIGTMGLSVLRPLAVYMLTVILGLSIHAVITLPVLLSLFGKYSPLKFIRDMFSAVATAFSTASSAATLPITMECLRENTGVSNKVASFVLPLGATVNMDGTALYEAVAAMFIAQAYGISLNIGQQLVIMLTATLASIGAAAIPGAGLVTMVIVLKAVNLPEEGIGMILAVDRILDMMRTAVNVWGDACGTTVVARLEGEELKVQL